jgi:hypothetical protein
LILLWVIGLCLAKTLAAQTSVPATRPADEQSRQAVAILSRQAFTFIQQHRYADADRVLHQALERNPKNLTCLYNLACVHTAEGRLDEAADDLIHATDAGFTDFTRFEHDGLSTRLQNVPRYRWLLAHKDEICHRVGQQIVEQLRQRFGSRYLFRVDEPRKLIVAAWVDPKSLDHLMEQLQIQLASQEEQIFSHPPGDFIRVVIVSRVDFSKLEHRPGVHGSYDDATRSLMVSQIGPELRHEFTHALHAADQHALDQEHPVWLSEGLATMYERPVFEAAGEGKWKMLPADTPRLANVQAAARHGSLIPIDKLVKLDRKAFSARADLAYGESACLLLYLHEHQLLKKFYDAYTAGYEQDPTGLSQLEAVTGVTHETLQEQWVQWLGQRTVPKANLSQLP